MVPGNAFIGEDENLVPRRSVSVLMQQAEFAVPGGASAPERAGVMECRHSYAYRLGRPQVGLDGLDQDLDVLKLIQLPFLIGTERAGLGLGQKSAETLHGSGGVRGQVTIHVRGHQVLRAEPRFR
jgi:hypothetical protein